MNQEVVFCMMSSLGFVHNSSSIHLELLHFVRVVIIFKIAIRSNFFTIIWKVEQDDDALGKEKSIIEVKTSQKHLDQV